jgi:hypothetical protein
MMKQKIYGLILLLICAGIVCLASQGVTMEERDMTPVLLLVPLGIYLLVSKEDCMYKFTGRSQRSKVTYGLHCVGEQNSVPHCGKS